MSPSLSGVRLVRSDYDSDGLLHLACALHPSLRAVNRWWRAWRRFRCFSLPIPKSLGRLGADSERGWEGVRAVSKRGEGRPGAGWERAGSNPGVQPERDRLGLGRGPGAGWTPAHGTVTESAQSRAI